MFLLALAASERRPTPSVAESIDTRVIPLLQETPLVDAHNDLHIHYHACREGCPRGYDAYAIGATVSGHTDLPRWKQGGVGVQLLNRAGSMQSPDLTAPSRDSPSRATWPLAIRIAWASHNVRGGPRHPSLGTPRHPDRN